MDTPIIALATSITVHLLFSFICRFEQYLMMEDLRLETYNFILKVFDALLDSCILVEGNT